jgi:hypothetical protein
MFTISDLERLQAEHPEWQMELVDGKFYSAKTGNGR